MRVSAFSKTYGGRCVLSFEGFTFERGRIYAIIGANGSGKSTFVRCLAGVEAPDGARRALHDGGEIAYMPQKSFAFRMSTRKNILLTGCGALRADEVMHALKIDHLADKRAKSLSGGESARMALGRLLVGEHEVLVLDEPCTSMDMESTLITEQLLKDYCKSHNAAVLIVTHSLQQARRIADEALYFQNGKLMEYGAAEKLLYTPDLEDTRRFLEFYGGA